MHQKPLLNETIEFFSLDAQKKEGVKLYEKYSMILFQVSTILLIGATIHWYFFGYLYAIVFGGLIITGAASLEYLFKKYYNFTEEDAVKHYALEVYQSNNPKESLQKLHLWNRNPFNIWNEYHYPLLADLYDESTQKQNPEEYAQEQIPDIIRLIERQENTDFHSLIDVNQNEYQIPEYYKVIIQEINYCYKFGAYTSTSLLLRKLTESLIEDILFSKGMYSKLPKEPTFKEMVTVFVDNVLTEEYTSETTAQLEKSLNDWIRKKGNKGAHISTEFQKDEIQTLMEHSQRTVRLLLLFRSNIDIDAPISSAKNK